MPKYTVSTADGRQFAINAPEGASQADILQYAQSNLGLALPGESQQEMTPEDILADVNPDRGFFGATGAGLSRGVTRMGSLVGNVLPALGASALGFDDYAKRQMQEAADTEAEIQRTNRPQFQSLSDVKGPGDWLPFLGETLGEQGANLAASIGTGGIGALVAKGLAKKAAEKELVGLATQRLGNAAEKELVKRTAAAEGLAPEFAAAPAEMVAAARGAAATPEAVSSIIPALPEYGAALRSAAGTGAVVGAGTASVGMNTGEIFQNIYESTGGELAPTAAVVGGAFAGALDTVLPAKFLRIFRESPPELKAAIIAKIAEAKQTPFAMAKLIGKGAVKNFGLEAATEGAQEAISIAAERFVGNTQEAWGAPEFDRIFESSVRGGIAGGALGAVGGVGEGLRERGIVREEEERKATEEAKAKAEKDAETRRLTEAQRVLEIPTELTDLRAKIEAFQASPEAQTRVGEFDLQEMMEQEQKLKDDLELFNTPEDKREELLKKRAGATTATAAPAPNKPLEEYTVADLFHQIGITQKDASTALGAYNRELAKNSADRIEFRKGKDLSYEVPAVGENAEKFRRFVSSVLNPDKVESLQTADKETKRAFRQRLDDVLGNNPKVQGHPTLTDEHIANAKAVQSTEDLSATDIDSVSRVISKRLGAIRPSDHPEEWYQRLTNLRAQAEAAGNADLVNAVDLRIANETDRKYSSIPDLLKPAAYTPEGYAYAATNFVKKLNENKDAVIPDHVFKITAKKLGIDSDTLPADREGRIQAIRSAFDAKTQELQENVTKAKEQIAAATTPEELDVLGKEGGGLHTLGFRVAPKQKSEVLPVEFNNQVRTEFNQRKTALKPTTPRGKASLTPEQLAEAERIKSENKVKKNLRAAKLSEIKNKIKDTIAGFETGQSEELKTYWGSLTPNTFDGDGFVLGPNDFKDIYSSITNQYNNKLRNLQKKEKNAKPAVSAAEAASAANTRQENTRITQVKRALFAVNKTAINQLKKSTLSPATKLTRLEELWNGLNTDIEAKAAAAKIPVDSYNNFLTELRAVYDPAISYADGELQTEKSRKEVAEAARKAAEAKAEADRLAAEAKAEADRLAAEAKAKAEAEAEAARQAAGDTSSTEETPAGKPPATEETPASGEAPKEERDEVIARITAEVEGLRIKKSGKRPAKNSPTGKVWDALLKQLSDLGVAKDKLPPDDLYGNSKPPKGRRVAQPVATPEEQEQAEGLDVEAIRAEYKDLLEVIGLIAGNEFDSSQISPQFIPQINEMAENATDNSIDDLTKKQLLQIIAALKAGNSEAIIIKKKEKPTKAQVEKDAAAAKGETASTKPIDPDLIKRAEAIPRRFEVGIHPKFLQVAIEGKTLPEAIKWVIDNGPTKYKHIAELVYNKLQSLEKQGFTFEFNINDGSIALTKEQKEDLLTVYGLVYPYTKNKKYEVWLNGVGNEPFKHGMDFETLLHEALHAATLAHTFERGPDVRSVKLLYQTVLTKLNNIPLNELAKKYSLAERRVIRAALKNVDEFIAYGLTNRTVQKFLDSIPYNNRKTKSLFDSFIEWVLSALGFDPKNDSALKELVIQTRKILESPYEDFKTRSLRESNLINDLTNSKFTPSAVLEASEEAPKPYEIRPPLTKVAVAVNEALSPRERVENSTTLAQNADKVYNKVFGALDNLIDKLPVWSQEFARKVLDFIQNLGENAKKFVMNLGSLDQLTDIAKLVNVDLAKAIQQVKSAVTDRNAMVDGYKERIEKLVNRARRIMKKYSAAVSKEFNDIVHESTLGEINFDDKKQYADPSKPKEMDAAKRREWEKLSARFNALPADMQQLYRDLRDEYQLYSNRFADLIRDASDSVGALSTGNKVLLQLMNRKIYPYFPLFRKGDYWLRFSVKDQKTGGYVDNVMAFESLGERRRFIANDLKNEDVAKLKDGRLDIQEFSRFGDVDINNLPPTSQFREMIKLLKESNVEEKVLNQVFKAYLDMFPTNSVMQQFRKRKGTAGYKDDAIGNFIDVGTRMALNVAQFSSSKAIDEAMKAARAAAGGGTGTETEKAIMGSLTDRERYLKSPMQKTGFDRFAAWAGLNSYRYFILGNISSAVVNLTQPFLTTLPLLSGRYGMGEAIRAMNEARRMYWKGGSDSNTESISPFTGRVMTDFTFGGDKSNLSPQMKRLYDKAVLAGAIRRSTGQDLMDMRSDGVKDPSSPFGIVHRVNTSLGWVFQNSERANREVSLLAAHNLELKRLLAKGVSQSKAEELAIEGAIRLVEEAHGSAMSETGPEFFQHGFGKLIGTFKRFALSQIYLVSKLAAKSLVGASKEEKRIAAKQLGYIYGNAFIFAGAKGLPFFGAVNLFSSMIAGLFGDDEPFDLEEEILRGPGNWFLRGPLGAAANIDLGSRTGFADLLWRDDPKRLADLGPMTYMLEMAGGPIMGVGKNVQSGYDLIRQGQVGRGIETMLPAVARNFMKTWRYTVDGVENRNGVKLVDDPNAYNLAMQLVGFNRNDLADVYARNSIMKTIERKDSERRANLLDRYDYARQEHDYDGMADLKEEMREYSRTGLGRTHPITSEVLQQSMKNRETKRRQMEQTSGAYYGKPNSAKVRYLEERAGVE